MLEKVLSMYKYVLSISLTNTYVILIAYKKKLKPHLFYKKSIVLDGLNMFGSWQAH